MFIRDKHLGSQITGKPELRVFSSCLVDHVCQYKIALVVDGYYIVPVTRQSQRRDLNMLGVAHMLLTAVIRDLFNLIGSGY